MAREGACHGSGRRYRFGIVLLWAVAATGCSNDGEAVGPLSLPDPCAPPDIATDDWSLVERPGFTFRLPPGFRDLNLQPVDSDGKIYELGRGDAFLSFDFGIYGRELDEYDCSRDIGGAQARVFVLDAGSMAFVGGFWRELGPPTALRPYRVSLSMTGQTWDPEVARSLLAAVYSVELKDEYRVSAPPRGAAPP